MAAAGEHPLEHSWVVWEQRSTDGGSGGYGESFKPIAAASTVESYWAQWLHIAPPSHFGGSGVRSLAVFLSGIRPAWEDAAHAHGGILRCGLSAAEQQLDRLWHTLVLGVIGGSIGGSAGHVTGLRVVDASNGGRPNHRLEVWVCTFEASGAVRDAIAVALAEAKNAFCPAEELKSVPAFAWLEQPLYVRTRARGLRRWKS